MTKIKGHLVPLAERSHSLELRVRLEAEAEKVKGSRPLAENRPRKVS